MERSFWLLRVWRRFCPSRVCALPRSSSLSSSPSCRPLGAVKKTPSGGKGNHLLAVCALCAHSTLRHRLRIRLVPGPSSIILVLESLRGVDAFCRMQCHLVFSKYVSLCVPFVSRCLAQRRSLTLVCGAVKHEVFHRLVRLGARYADRLRSCLQAFQVRVQLCVVVSRYPL